MARELSNIHLCPIDTEEMRKPHTSIYLALNLKSFWFTVKMALIQLKYESELKGPTW